MTEERMPDRKLVLDSASQAVLRDRNKSYGEPDEDFQRIARIASAMGFRLDPGDGSIRHLKGSDVSLFMIALKTSRLTWSPDHQDSWVDVAGYAACGFETARLQAAREASAQPVEVRSVEAALVPLPEGGDREGPRRLGVTPADWKQLKELADRVQNGETPSVLESRGFMIITLTTNDCRSWICTLAKGQEVHAYQGDCHYRIRPRRPVL